MAVPIVAIVGRPNVGKSSLFNWLVGRRLSIVDPTAGVTRDRVAALVEAGDRHFELVDTGGMGIEDVDNLTADVERQIQHAIDEAHLVLFVVDARDGLMPLDELVADRLRAVSKPILCVANKCDTEALDTAASDFYQFGFEPVVKVSAEQKRGRPELLDEIFKRLPESVEEPAPEEPVLEIAIVGRRNVGKSTFINALAQSERVIVSEVPGTTRDSIDVRFERDGKAFVAIDTAGVRKKSSIANDVEFYSTARAERSIRRAGVVLHFFDPRLRVSRVDKQLAEYVLEHHKPAIFVVNKWDLARDQMPTERWANYLRTTFPMLDFVPIAFVTAKNGRNVYKLLNLAQHLYKQAGKRVSTGDLNRVVRMALEQRSPPARFNRLPKVYYATQVEVHPPTVVLFTNGPELFDNTYLRYLTKVLRDHLPFTEVPVKLQLRKKQGVGGETPDGEAEPVEAAENALEPKPKPKPERKKRKGEVDVESLPFRTEVSEEEARRKRDHYDSELWDI